MLGLPNSSRSASDSVVTGFHSAIACSGPGIDASGTNVLAMNVSGNSAAKAMPVTPSGVADQAAEEHADPDHGEGERQHQQVAGHGVDDARTGCASR